EIQNQKINTLQEEIKALKRKEDRYDEKGNKPQEFRYRVQAKELNKFVDEIKSGKVYDLKKISDYAASVGKNEYRRRKDKENRREAREKQVERALESGAEVSKIDYQKGTAIIGGQEVRVDKDTIKNIKLSSVKRAEDKQVIDKINTKIKENKPLTFKDLEAAKKVGISSKQLTSAVVESGKISEKINTYYKALEDAKKGKRPDVVSLMRKGIITGDEATNIVKAFETSPQELEKIKDKDFSKVWERLIPEPGKKKSSLTALDSTTQVRAFKTTVNQELKRSGIEPVKLSADTTKFEKEYNKLLDMRENLKKTIKKDVKEKTLNEILKNELSLKNKALTGQSMTPKELKLLEKQIELQGNELTKAQIEYGKKLWNLPAVYARQIKIRSQKGEKNALYNDFKKIGKGALKEVGDLINVVTGVKGLTINSKGESFDGIIAKGARGFLDYETRVIKELTQGKSVKNVIGDDLKKIVKSSKEIGNKTVDVIKFMKENPIGTLILVSAGIEAGIIGSKKEFMKNPEENIGRAIVWLFPGKIIKGVVSTSKLGFKVTGDLTKDLVKISRYLKNSKVPVRKRKGDTFDYFFMKKKSLGSFIKDYPKEKFLKLKMSRINKIVDNAKNKASINFKVGSKLDRSKILLETKLKKILEIPKNVKLSLNKKQIDKIVSNYEKLNDKPIITFKVGSKKETLINKLNKVLDFPKEQLRTLKINRINKIVNNVAKKQEKLILKFKAGDTKERVINKLNKILDIPKNKLMKMKISRINKLVENAKNKPVITFKIGTKKETIINKLNELYAIPKDLLKKLKLTKINKIVDKINKSRNKPIITFKIGTKKETIIRKLNELLGIPKKILQDLNMKQINKIVDKRNKEVISFTVVDKAKVASKTRGKKFLAGKKAQARIPQPVLKEVNKLEDKTSAIMKEALSYNKNDIIRFKVGKQDSVTSFKVGKQLEKMKVQKSILRKKLKSITKLKIKTKNPALYLIEVRLLKNLTRISLLTLFFERLSGFTKQNKNLANKDYERIKKDLRDVLKINERIKIRDIENLKDQERIRIKLIEQLKIRINDVLRDVKTIKIPKTESRLAPTIKMTEPPKIPPKIKLPKISFDSNKLDNRIIVFEARYRERKNKSKPFNKKNNPVVVKTIKKKTTKNRMLKIVANRTDKSLVRSMNIFVREITNRKVKDIKKPSLLSKFRQKKSKNTPVLQLVEKTKFSQDTRGEKKEIKKIKKISKKNKPIKQKKKSKKSKKKSIKTKKSKKSSK
ncbi:MAG: hypothetical protein ACQEQF_11340, partial [Bacillota bacterium]